VPKRALPGPFSYVDGLSARQAPSSFGAAFPAVSVPNEQPVAISDGHHKRAGSLAGIPSIFPATSITTRCKLATRPRSRSTIGDRARSRSRRLSGVAFVTTRPQPAAFVRVVTNHGSDTNKSERERERTTTTRRNTTDQSDLFHRPDQKAEATQRPGLLPSLGARPRAAQADRGAVRGHARPARAPDRPQLPHRARAPRPLVQRRLDTQRQACCPPGPVRLAHSPGQQTRRVPVPSLGSQPRAHHPHRGRHRPAHPPRAGTATRRVAMRALARAELAVALRPPLSPARRGARQRQTDRNRGRAHAQKPRPPCNDRRAAQLGLRLGLVLRPRASASRVVRARRNRALRQRHHSPPSAQPDRLAAARGLGSHLRLMPSRRFERRHVPHPRPRHHDGGELAIDSSHLADLIAERLVAHSRERSRWIGADVVAEHLGVDVSFVYEHATELGARRLGTGPKARLRFRLDLVDEALRSSDGCSENQEFSKTAPSRRRQARPSSGPIPLLPVRQSRSDS
jgi:hypothetical protein